MSADFHLAQTNIARMRAPMDDPVMPGFVEQLEPLNALATAFTSHLGIGATG